MSPYLRAFFAEAMKLRGTLALVMCIVAPITITLLNVVMIGSHDGTPAGMTPDAAWHGWIRNSYALWCLLMLPLFVTLEAALLAQLEHANRQWKHLLALPLPRSAHYLGKWVVLTLATTLATLMLALLCVLSGWTLHAWNPAFRLVGMPPLGYLLRMAMGIVLASGLIVAFHTWVSQRWRSFTVAVSVGIIATTVGLMMGQSTRYGHLFPWSLGAQLVAPNPLHLQEALLLGSVGGLLVLGLGLLDFSRLEID